MKQWLLFVISFYLLGATGGVISVHAQSRCLESLQETSVQQKASLEHIVSLRVQKSYVEGKAQAQQLIFLRADQFQEATRNDLIPVDSILIMDELPLVEDLPLVSGILIGKKLSLDATHGQFLAEKLGIPLVVVEAVFDHPELRTMAKKSNNFKLECLAQRCSLQVINGPFVRKPRPASVLPRRADRFGKMLFMPKSDWGLATRETSGDKYFSLLPFKNQFKDLVPPLSALSSGFYEAFLDEMSYEGVLLRVVRRKILKQLKIANENGDEEMVKKSLAEMRQAILEAKSVMSISRPVFDVATKELKTQYGVFKRRYSFRSNNDVEDLLAAGLYKSVVSGDLQRKNVEASLRTIWASLYDYRAYSIRRYWGQNEENLSMPVMIHPFVEGNNSHAVGSFRRTFDDKLEFEVNMAFGEGERATNPSEKARALRFKIKEINPGEPKIYFYDREGGNLLTAKEQKALVDFYSRVSVFVNEEFENRSFALSAVNVEFVIEKGGYFWKAPKISVLQYKPSLSTEVALGVIVGEIPRELTDKKMPPVTELGEREKVLHRLGVKDLATVVPDYIRTFEKKNSDVRVRDQHWYRYALIVDRLEPMLVVWQSGEFHQKVKARIEREGYQWLKSGYVKFGEYQGKTFLKLTETTLEFDTDVAMPVEMSQRIFQSAFDRALARNKELKDLLIQWRSEVIFSTYEGDGLLMLRPEDTER